MRRRKRRIRKRRRRRRRRRRRKDIKSQEIATEAKIFWQELLMMAKQ